MTVNVENINKMIEAIKASVDPIKMSGFVSRNGECGTTACIAGWANILRTEEKGTGRAWRAEFESEEGATAFMGISYNLGNALFYDFRADRLNDEDRKTAAIRLLERLRDTGGTSWDEVLDTTYTDGVVHISLKN